MPCGSLMYAEKGGNVLIFLPDSDGSGSQHALYCRKQLLRGLDPVAVAERQHLLVALVEQQRRGWSGMGLQQRLEARQQTFELSARRDLDEDTLGALC